MIREEFVTIEVAKALKAAGFNLRCLYFYRLEGGKHAMRRARLESDFNAGDLMSCPSLGLATRWIREKGHHVYASFDPVSSCFRFVVQSMDVPYSVSSENVFNSYEEAMEMGIMRALGIMSFFK